MPRYIDADDLENITVVTYEGRLKRIDAPIADVEEVKHGHWVPRSDCSKADCSRCGRGRADIWFTSNGMRFDIKGEEANFCNVCGAKMDGKENGE